MPNAVMLYWRTLGGTLGGLLVTWLAGHGLKLPDTATEWLTGLLVGLGVTVYVAVSHWLQTRAGTSLAARVARVAGRVMVAGAGAVPIYRPAAKP
jgi:uncharacterized membrane protein (DUF441 family)